MKLYTICRTCNQEVRIRSMSSTRPDLEREKGEEFEINCMQCGSRYHIHVNDVSAKESNMIIALGIGLSVVATVFLWNYFGAMSTLSAILPGLIWGQESKSVRNFNSYKIRRR